MYLTILFVCSAWFSCSFAQRVLMSQVLTGNVIKGYNGEGLPATSSLLPSPFCTWGDTNGIVYIADRNRIRKVVNGTMTTLVGTQYSTFNGDGYPGTSTNLAVVTSVWGDSMGSFLYFSDVSIQKIRRYSFATGIVSSVIGSGATGLGAENVTGTSCAINSPYFIYGDSVGNIFYSDQTNHRIRKYSIITTLVVTIVGTTGGPGFNDDNITGTSMLLNNPSGLWGDSDGNIIFSDRYNYRVRKWTRSTQRVITVAGTGATGFNGDSGPATLAKINTPLSVYVDKTGIIYFLDSVTQRIRYVMNGIINSLMGGITGNVGDGGPATSAYLSAWSIWANSNGRIYISDVNNYKVRYISGGIIDRFAGTGYYSCSGDSGPATLAAIDSPGDVWGDSNGNIYITDTNNYRVRMINSSNIITTFGGSGLNSWTATGNTFLQTGIGGVTSIYGDSLGGFYYSASNTIRKATSPTSIVTSVAGEGGGAETGFNVSAKGARFSSPRGLFVNSLGNIYFADQSNQVVRLYVKQTQRVLIIAGNGTAGFSGDGGYATSAKLCTPYDTWGDTNGVLYISDINNNRIRRVDLSNRISTFAGTGIRSSGTIDNVPATSSNLNLPYGISGDAYGNVYIAEYNGARIRMIYTDPVSGNSLIRTLLGTGSSTTDTGKILASTDGLGTINAVWVDSPTQNIYFVELTANLVRQSFSVSVPTSQPTAQPSGQPSRQPISRPTGQPSVQPSRQPSSHPTNQPTMQPSSQPLSHPTAQPSSQPTSQPTLQPSSKPSSQPSSQPTKQPSSQPTSQPFVRPTSQPTDRPSSRPSLKPTNQPSTQPSLRPTTIPTNQPTSQPTLQPFFKPSSQPSSQPTKQPSSQPTSQPSSEPLSNPTSQPSSRPSSIPTRRPINQPTLQPTSTPSTQPISHPSSCPTLLPSSTPSTLPSTQPSSRPTTNPISSPTLIPTSVPSSNPSTYPSRQPSSRPTIIPISAPTYEPTTSPSNQPSSQPTLTPSSLPSSLPNSNPSVPPSMRPISCPSTLPTTQKQAPLSFPTSLPSLSPSAIPNAYPTSQPSTQPSSYPTSIPSTHPSQQLTSQPTRPPTVHPTNTQTRTPSCLPTALPTTSLTIANFPTTSPSQQSLGSLPQNLSIIFNDDHITSSFIDQNNIKIVLLLISPQPSLPLNELFGDVIISLSTLSTSSGSNNMILGDANLPSSISFPTGSTVFDDDYEKLINSNLVHSFPYGLISDQVGRSLASAGDVNKDGVIDILLGDFRSSKVYVFLGNRSPLSRWKDMNQGYTASSSTRGDSFGWAVSGISDFNEDGIEDWMSCAIITNRCYIIYGQETGNTDISVQQLTKATGFTITAGGGKLTALGMAITGGGDTNGDGLSDVVISAISTTGDSMNIVFIVYGGGSRLADKGTLNLNNMILGVDGRKIVAPYQSFAAMSISLIGDMNGDQIADVAIGSIPYENGQYVSQVSYIVYGKDNNSVTNSSQLLIISSLKPSEGMKIIGGGFIVSGINDVNEDGYNDIMVVSYDNWRGQMGGYVVLNPEKGFITSAPTVHPSSKPTYTHQPSLMPTIVTTSQVTSSQPFLSSNTSMFPTNIGSLTNHPSHHPTTSIPSRVPTRIPSLSPTFRQSKVKTIAPTASSVPTLLPTYRRTSLPSQVPTIRPTKTIAPSYTMTRSPSTAPTLPLPPSVKVSSLSSNITTITQGGIYSTSSQSKCCLSCSFLISTSDDVTITPQGNDGCKQHYYKILPLTTTITSIIRQGTLLIKSFNIEIDIIDLTAFSSLHNLTEVSYSNSPVILLLSSSSSSDITQKIILPSLSSFSSLTASNFIFTSSGSSEQGGTSFQLFAKDLITAFAFMAFLVGLTLLYAFRERIIGKSIKKMQQETKEDKSSGKIVLDLHKESPDISHYVKQDMVIASNLLIEVSDRDPISISYEKEARRSHRSSRYGGSIHDVDSDSTAYKISSDDSDDFDSFSDDDEEL